MGSHRKDKERTMDHIKILKRAFNITWVYRALWVFGIILALTTGGNGGNGAQGADGGGRGDTSQRFEWPEELPAPPFGELPTRPFEEWPSWELPSEYVGTAIAVGIGLACVFLAVFILLRIARYVAETALIRMVDDYEETGEKRSVRQGFRLGWSRAAWRLFLINLVIGLPLVVVSLLLFLIPAGLIFLSVRALEGVSVAIGVIGIIAGVGLFFLILLCIIIVAIVLSLLMPFFRRACVLGGMGVIESIQEGIRFVRRHLKDVGIMWLLMIGLGIAWIIVMIPVFIALVLVGVLTGGLPALLLGGLASLVAKGAAPWILAAVVGIPVFLLVVAAPALFLSGLKEVFVSSTWTLTYRELHALQGLNIEPGLEPDPESAEWQALEDTELDEANWDVVPDSA
jgi:hypothetical protein